MSIGFRAAPSARVELVAAARDSLSHAELGALAQSRHREVRVLMAARPDVPLGVLAALATDSCHRVRAAVAGNPRAARSLIERLCTDHHPEVARGLLQNQAVSREVLAALAGHRKSDVRELALARLEAAPLVRVEPDPDARFPELRDRVAQAAVAAPLLPPAPTAAQIPVTYASSLSLLAQRISLGPSVPVPIPVPMRQAAPVREVAPARELWDEPEWVPAPTAQHAAPSHHHGLRLAAAVAS